MLVAIFLNIQPLLNWSFTSDELTAAITVLCAVIVAVRQIVNGRTNWFGGRPKGFQD